MSSKIQSLRPDGLKMNKKSLTKGDDFAFDEVTYKSQAFTPDGFFIKLKKDKGGKIWVAFHQATMKGSGSILQTDQELKECFAYYAYYDEALLILNELRYTLSEELKELFPADMENNYFQLNYSLKNKPGTTVEKKLPYEGNDIVISRDVFMVDDELIDYEQTENFEIWYIDLSRGKVQRLSDPEAEGKKSVFSVAAPNNDRLVRDLGSMIDPFLDAMKDKSPEAGVEQTESLLAEVKWELLTNYDGWADDTDLTRFLIQYFPAIEPFLQALEE